MYIHRKCHGMKARNNTVPASGAMYALRYALSRNRQTRERSFVSERFLFARASHQQSERARRLPLTRRLPAPRCLISTRWRAAQPHAVAQRGAARRLQGARCGRKQKEQTKKKALSRAPSPCALRCTFRHAGASNLTPRRCCGPPEGVRASWSPPSRTFHADPTSTALGLWQPCTRSRV